jgi:hypothetical protein
LAGWRAVEALDRVADRLSSPITRIVAETQELKACSAVSAPDKKNSLISSAVKNPIPLLIRPFCLLPCLFALFAVFMPMDPLSAAEQKPLKVFILAGQSNMQGHAQVRTFEHMGMDAKTKPFLEALQKKDGTPRTCEDVWISYLSTGSKKKGRLSAGFGADENKIGPELAFGITMERALDEPILIIKTAWGGKSLHTDFRSPSSGPYEFGAAQLEQFAKRGNNLEKLKAEKLEATGVYYRLMIAHVKEVLADIVAVYPDYASKAGYELAGFVWFQGWNDMVDSGAYPARNHPGGYDAYSEALAHFIRDVREDLSAPEMPFVIGVLGVGGPVEGYSLDQERYKATHQNFRSAMSAPAKLPEFKGNVQAVLTENYWDFELQALIDRDEKLKRESRQIQKVKELDGKAAALVLEKLRAEEFSEREREILKKGVSNQAYHYLGSAKIMVGIGRGFAEAMIGMLASPSKPQASIMVPQTPEGIPDFTRGGEVPENAGHDWNMGPTGARGWIYSNKLETSEARQIAVTKVEASSPADGVLEPGDVILGIDEQFFSYDPRTELGKAISAAEASDGNLSLMRWRVGRIEKAVVSLELLGSYSSTAPFDCAKSTIIFEQGCEALAAQMKANPDDGNNITRPLNALALLASGNPEYLPLVREQVMTLSKFSDPERRTYHSWFYGPITILVAEYTLATGDQDFMPDLERLALEIVRGQSAVGSWGHRFVQDNGILAGYGMMNAPGLPLTLALVLARAAGVDDPSLDTAVEKSTRLLRFYVGKGSIPYGDHRPWTETHDDNGKNGAAAVLFNLLGDDEAAEFFSRMAVASHSAEREMGHTGNYFNMLWALPSVALSGPEATGAWMREFGWHYDLARRWDGTWRHQGPPQERPDSYRNWDSSGAYLLAYAQPLRKIYLTGKEEGGVPWVDSDMAADLISDGRDWSPRLKAQTYSDRDEAALLDALKSWSPVVRERAAMALGKREGDPTRELIRMLGSEDLSTRLGACQGLAMLKKRAAPAVRALRETLKAEDLWLRIEAAEALAAIGVEAMPAVPDLLEMLADLDSVRDPRAMQQRYLCFALFDQSDGLLRGSLEGVDREDLYRAVRVGLANEDGRARGALGTVYRNLSYEEIEPLWPAIIEAVAKPAPSGIMFADGIRLSGLELLAKYHHKEGLDYFFDVMGIDRWGQGSRVTRCLKILQSYGGAAKPLLPQLLEIEQQYLAKKTPPEPQLRLLQETIALIEADDSPPKLRSFGGR